MIRFENVTKAFADGTVAVDDLTLEMPSGQITVLVGPSGCGKTTTLRMINRMIDATSGRILIDDTDVATVDPPDLRRGIGYVIQNAGLFPHRTVEDNIATVPRLLGASKPEARATAREQMERVGLPESFATRYPAQLSGGQQQRVGVARALAADPPILLMDEPFSALDPIVREGLQNELIRLQGELGKTIAFVTHDIDEAIKLGDQVALLRQGGVIAQFGPPQELLESPADEFVADFVGRDRGFRSLSFEPATALPGRPVDELPDHVELVRDSDGVATGWRSAAAPGEVFPLGGTFTDGDSVRVATDLSISSPVGIALRVDGAGRPTGIISHSDIARHLQSRRAAGSAAG
ncbi:ATP-binding cassette domain-containing protein [Epidermidibacterium keratini]|uniref:ABC-type quaternary amine transporter n=1 Tax=Epidermidibacterium keratini TaxID=1891644 RepID=A0A7L4YL07_9ACTN|nr:ABC transporter ATP-binding protein [Epidermidibacterium keratini]QHB99741.1 ATP-binding cassette domain-containing protein [Epidermidibacterium keratini]